ncbi:MAG: hypothetical protein JNL98_04370 [Bryobacterales bacterium]|nr:hypothetical protein [Bryobacterales bacterium]
MAGAVSRTDTFSPDPAGTRASAPIPFRIHVSWNSLITGLMPAPASVNRAETSAVPVADWPTVDWPDAQPAEEPARWAMVVPKMDRDGSGTST